MLSLSSWGSVSLILCDATDCSPLGSSVHRILQARILGWVATFHSRGLPNQGLNASFLVSPALAGGFFTTEPPGNSKLGVGDVIVKYLENCKHQITLLHYRCLGYLLFKDDLGYQIGDLYLIVLSFIKDW